MSQVVGCRFRQAPSEEEDGEENNSNNKRRNIYIVVALVGLLIVAGAVVGTVALQNRPTEETATPSPSSTPGPGAPTPPLSQAPTRLTRAQKVKTILADLAPWNEQAISWLKDIDTWEPAAEDPNSDYLWMERYVMADLYYSTNGTNWTRNDRWLSNETVCNWYLNVNTTKCTGPLKDMNVCKYSFSHCFQSVYLCHSHCSCGNQIAMN